MKRKQISTWIPADVLEAVKIIAVKESTTMTAILEKLLTDFVSSRTNGQDASTQQTVYRDTNGSGGNNG